MRRIMPMAAFASFAAGTWTLIAPWVYRSSAMSTGHMMGGTMHSSGVVVTSSTYYWHIVPGVLAILLSVILLMAGRLVVERSMAAALFVVGLWTLVGPWVLPNLGMGHSMHMGVTTGSFLRHILAGAVLIVASVVAYVSLPARKRVEPNTADGLRPA